MVAGSTGEAPLLDETEVVRLVELAREVSDDRLVVAGTGAESTRATARLSVWAAEKGADGVLVRPPFYYREAMTSAVLRDHFLAVAEASPVPVILYNIPKYVPVPLTAELVAELLRHENVAGIKDSSGDMRTLGALAEACADRGELLVGAGTHLYAGLELGAAGGILAVGLLAPAEACRLHGAWSEGDRVRAGALQERIGPLHRAVVGRHGVPGVKRALGHLGLAGGAPRPPLRPLTGRAAEEVERALEAAGRADGGS